MKVCIISYTWCNPSNRYKKKKYIYYFDLYLSIILIIYRVMNKDGTQNNL